VTADRDRDHLTSLTAGERRPKRAREGLREDVTGSNGVLPATIPRIDAGVVASPFPAAEPQHIIGATGATVIAGDAGAELAATEFRRKSKEGERICATSHASGSAIQGGRDRRPR
jgi:hypothetical protein